MLADILEKYFNIESKHPTGSDKSQKKYLQNKLNKLEKYFSENLEYCQYMRNNMTFLPRSALHLQRRIIMVAFAIMPKQWKQMLPRYRDEVIPIAIGIAQLHRLLNYN